MKRRSRPHRAPQRADDDDWIEEDWPIDLQIGHASGEEDPEGDPSAPVLWIPDPEARRGWREYTCEPEEEARAPIGFRAAKGASQDG